MNSYQNFKKTDRLHPIVTILYILGEDEWDGPRSLIDMLDIPEEFESLISIINLI